MNAAMRIRSRRGEGITALLLITIMVVVILVGIMFYLRFGSLLGKGVEAQCATEVLSHAQVVKLSKETIAPKILCPTNMITVTPDDQDDARKVLADEMANCWETWGEGKMVLFENEKGVFCHVCSSIQFNDIGAIEGLPAYLDAEEHKKDVTYAQYLHGVEEGTFFDGEEFQKPSAKRIPTDRPIAVIFVYSKDQDVLKTVKNWFTSSIAPGAAGGIVVGYGGAALLTKAAAVVGVTLGAKAIATGIVVGTISGAVYSYTVRETMDYMAFVVVRPTKPEDIQSLGCTYLPTENQYK
jgi:hypothetical protein